MKSILLMERLKIKKSVFPSFLIAYCLLLIPIPAFASTSLIDIITGFGGLITKAIPITFALALLFFFYGVAKFILAAGNVSSKEDGKSIMVWGIVALFVMVSIWGLVKFVGDNLGISAQTGITQ